VVLMLLDRSAREVLLEGSALSSRQPVEVQVDLNGSPGTKLLLVPSPRPLRLSLLLTPGYNLVRFRARGSRLGAPGSQPKSFGLGAMRVRGED
jgi:hypothetical protein